MTALRQNAPFVFIDDAHTFGGTQIALGWAIRVVLRQTDANVLCICTGRTRAAIEKITGANPRLSFEEAPSALPLNLVFFPFRLFHWWRLIRRVRKHEVRAWWLNLADIEFCLAPLLVLRSMGEFTRAYQHGTSPFTFFHRASSWKRRVLSKLRDAIADRFVFRLHPLLITPSRTSLDEVKNRIRSRQKPVLGFLYYPPIGEDAGARTAPSPIENLDHARHISIWMIGAISQGHKNNRAALDTLEVLEKQGYTAGLTVAGDGPDFSAFQEEANRRGLSSQISYLGWVANPCDMVPRDAVILIPSFHETMNIVAREAMRNGLRLAVSPIPIFHEWIPGPLIASSFSPESFAAKIMEVRQMRPDDLGTLYDNALAQFSDKIFIDDFLRYSNVISLDKESGFASEQQF